MTFRDVYKVPRTKSKELQISAASAKLSPHCSITTNKLDINKLHQKVAKLKPLPTQTQYKACFTTAKSHSDDVQDFGDNILQCDRTKVELFLEGVHTPLFAVKLTAFQKKTHAI